jgi:hypothetical protein
MLIDARLYFNLALSPEADRMAVRLRRLGISNRCMGGVMSKLLGLMIIAACGFPVGYAQAAETVLFPDARGNMVPIHVAHSYPQCMANGRKLGYPDDQSHTWCTAHCNGTICQ